MKVIVLCATLAAGAIWWPWKVSPDVAACTLAASVPRPTVPADECIRRARDLLERRACMQAAAPDPRPGGQRWLDCAWSAAAGQIGWLAVLVLALNAIGLVAGRLFVRRSGPAVGSTPDA